MQTRRGQCPHATMADVWECPVCYHSDNDRVIGGKVDMVCGHVLCLTCCIEIFKRTPHLPLCPLCREPFYRPEPRKRPHDDAGGETSTPAAAERSTARAMFHDLLRSFTSDVEARHYATPIGAQYWGGLTGDIGDPIEEPNAVPSQGEASRPEAGEGRSNPSDMPSLLNTFMRDAAARESFRANHRARLGQLNAFRRPGIVQMDDGSPDNPIEDMARAAAHGQGGTLVRIQIISRSSGAPQDDITISSDEEAGV